MRFVLAALNLIVIIVIVAIFAFPNEFRDALRGNFEKSSGPPGVAGSVGPAGPPGLTGPQGPPGPPAESGPEGPTGPQGETGSPGPMGPQGVAGSEGSVGPQGETGTEGPVRPRGETGNEGPAGPQGETGAEGQIGAPGPAGIDVAGGRVKTGTYVGNDNNAEKLLSHSITGIGFQPSVVFSFLSEEGFQSSKLGTLGLFVKTDQDGEYAYLTVSPLPVLGDPESAVTSLRCRGWIMSLDADGFTVSTGKAGSEACTGAGPNLRGKTYTYIAYES